MFDLNSQSYWDKRFRENWERRGGRQQSRAFAEFAIKHMPSGLISAIEQDRLSVLDWGCALGDGTNLLAATLHTKVTGIDFAEPAIESARQNYPSCEFLCVELTEKLTTRIWDIAFSSNTLEHFSNPWDIVDRFLLNNTRSALILLVPYQEKERYEEHFYTFRSENIPLSIGSFHLVHSVIFDASIEPAAMWDGPQILLVYATSAFAKRTLATLADVTIINDVTYSNILPRSVAEQEAATLREALRKEKQRAAMAEEERGEWQNLAEAMRRSTSWRTTAPLRSASQRFSIIKESLGRNRDRASALFAITRSHGPKRALRWIWRRVNARLGRSASSSGKGLPFDSFGSPPALLKPLFEPIILMCAGVPFEDVGGGQRSAQLARVLSSSGFRVIYIYAFKRYDQNLGSYVESPELIGGIRHYFIDDVDPSNLIKSMPDSSIVIFELPHPKYLKWLDISKALRLHTVFELIDEWNTSLGLQWFEPDIYHRFVKSSDAVTGTARILVKQMLSLGRDDVKYIPNAVNEEIFDKYKNFERPADVRNDRPYYLYYGSLYGDWFSWECIERAAVALPDADFVLIGDHNNTRVLPDNVRLLGPRGIAQLPAYLAHCHAALLPFIPGRISEAVSPIKIFEYISMGKLVISTRLPEIIDYPNVILANNSADFAIVCSRVGQTEVVSPDFFVSRNSWACRAESILQLSGKKDVTVVVLMRNNEAIIERCLSSIIANASPYLAEVIVVDNASQDAGVELVEKKFPQVTLMKNEKNGCSSGRNLGIARCTSKYIAFLDSDQWLTSGLCVAEAVSILNKHNEIGAVGWVAGWLGYQRGRDLGGPLVENLVSRGIRTQEYIESGFRTDIHYLGTGGLFMRLEDVVAAGGFDEAYDPTCFEDTDLSFAVRKRGQLLAYRNLTGIRHQPHQTTGAKSGSESYRRQFKQNSDFFKQKWASELPKLAPFSDG